MNVLYQSCESDPPRHVCRMTMFDAEPRGACHALITRLEARGQSFPSVHLLIETDDGKSVKWRLCISLVNQTHLDTFAAWPCVSEPRRACHALIARLEAHGQSCPRVYLLWSKQMTVRASNDVFVSVLWIRCRVLWSLWLRLVRLNRQQHHACVKSFGVREGLPRIHRDRFARDMLSVWICFDQQGSKACTSNNIVFKTFKSWE